MESRQYIYNSIIINKKQYHSCKISYEMIKEWKIWKNCFSYYSMQKWRKLYEKCVQSFLDQSYPMELLTIVIADGMSTDNTRNIIEKLKRK